MESLKDLTCTALINMLPKECLDALVEKEINKRTVWVLGNRVFSTHQAACTWQKKYDDDTGGFYIDCQPLRVVLDQPVGDEIFLHTSGSGLRTLDGLWWSPIEFIHLRAQDCEKNTGVIFEELPAERYIHTLNDQFQYVRRAVMSEVD